MRKTMPIIGAVALTVITMSLSIAAAYQAATGDQSGQRRSAIDGAPIADPRRRNHPPPPAPPDLPDLRAVQPLTLEIAIRRTNAGKPMPTIRETIARTADRIHIGIGTDVEWLLERSSVDPRRVSGALIDHRKRVIVRHDESDLRIALAINGWLHALTGGLDQQSLSTLKRSSDSKRIGGIEFTRYSTERERRAGLEEVWWSEPHVLAARLVVTARDATTTLDVEEIREGVDRTVLQPPVTRFPAYRVTDRAEWLEGH
jgi:hypothetical protein